MTMRRIAVYDRNTGLIRQVVTCHKDDIDKQHLAFGGCGFLDITVDFPNAKPALHMIDLVTMTVQMRQAPLAEVRAKKVTEIYNACTDAITHGFVSDALGADFTYGANQQDQLNLLIAVVAGGGMITCADTNGNWARRRHTPLQARGVLQDFVAARDAFGLRYFTRLAQLAAAANATQANNIIW